MVKLEDTLTKIISKRKDTLTGEDILNIVNAIQVCRLMDEREEAKSENDEMMKKQKEYEKIGQEYLYGGE